MLAQSMTEQEIADKLGVDRTTISRDVTILKKMSQQFVNGIEVAKRKAWIIFNRLTESSGPGAVKDSLLALKPIVDCSKAQFSLFKEGPAITQIKRLEERLAHIESRESNQELRKEV